MAIYKQDILDLSEEEKRAIEEIKKDAEGNFNVLFNVKYQNLNRHNAEEFHQAVLSVITQVANQVKEAEFEFMTFKKEFKNKVVVAKESGAPTDSPWTNVIDADERAIRSLHKSVTYRALIIEFLGREVERLINLLNESKNIEFEKVKSDVLKDSYDNLLTKTQQQYDNIITKQQIETDMLRKELRETTLMFRKFAEKQSTSAMDVAKRVAIEALDDEDDSWKKESEEEVQLKTIAKELPSPVIEDVKTTQTSVYDDIIDDARKFSTKKDAGIYLVSKLYALGLNKEQIYETTKNKFPNISMGDIAFYYSFAKQMGERK